MQLEKYKKGDENLSPSPATYRLHFLDVSLPHPSVQGVPKHSSKQRIGFGLNVNKYPQGVESFVIKKHSWGGKGNQSSRKALQTRKKKQWERDGKPREESEIRVVGAERTAQSATHMSAWTTVVGIVQQGLGQGTLRRPILASNQGVSLGPGLICFLEAKYLRRVSGPEG